MTDCLDTEKKILLVEDEALIAMAEEMVLKNYGFDVTTVYSGEAAIKAVNNGNKVDLVLMDINLGEKMDGTQAAQKILEDHELPLIFLSSHTEREVVEKTEGITSYGYIVKNSGETVLVASIKMAFRLFEARQQQKQKEKELRESEQRFNRMLNVVPDMISIHDPQMNILYSNWQGIAEVPEDKRIIGTKCYNTYRGYDDICPDCLAKEVLTNATSMQREAELPDGRWVDLRVIPLVDERGQVEMFMEWVRDITARKQNEQEILRNEDRLKRLVDILQFEAGTTQQFFDKALREAVKLTGSEIGYILLYNEKLCAYELNTWFGDAICTEVEAGGGGSSSAASAYSTSTASPAADKKACRTFQLEETGIWGEAFRRRVPVLINDFQSQQTEDAQCPNSNVPIHTFLSIPVYKNPEQIAAVVGVANKKTPYDQVDALQLTLLLNPVWKSVEIMQKEEALRDSEERLSLALEATRDGVWDWNLETDTLYWSPQAYRMLGYEPDEFPLTSEVWRGLVHPEDYNEAWNTVTQNISERGDFFTIKFRYRTKSGSWKWILGHGKPVAWDSDGRATRMVGIHVDIAARYNSEENILQDQG